MIGPTYSMTYTIVVGQDSLLFEALVSAINVLDILARDIQNDYLKDPTKGKF